MEKQDDLTLMKPRSYRRVLAAGFKLYTENFRRLFKASWQMAILYALSCGALGTLLSIKLPEITVMIMQQIQFTQTISLELLQHYYLIGAEMLLLLILTIATLCLGSATILNKLSEHRQTGAITMPPRWLSATPRLMGRTLKGVFLTLLVTFLPLLAFIGTLALAETLSTQFTMRHITTIVATFCLLSLIIAMLALPLMHVLMRYIMEPSQGYWRTLANCYPQGLSHWGLLFLVFFVSTLLVQLTALIIMMPSHILNFANQQAQAGLLIGDPLGMPSYIMPLTFGTYMLCSFLEFYISQVTLVHNYYLYGSIETQEKEKNHEENTSIQ